MSYSGIDYQIERHGKRIAVCDDKASAELITRALNFYDAMHAQRFGPKDRRSRRCEDRRRKPGTKADRKALKVSQ